MLHVAQPTDGGVARCVLELVQDQVRRGWPVALAGPRWGSLAGEVERAGGEWYRWEAARAPGPVIVPETRALARIIHTVEPEVVHLHSSKAGLAGRLALRGRRRTVFQPHAWSFEAAEGAVRWSALRWERFGARWADAVVCVSEAERRRGVEEGIRAKWRVVLNGVDLDVWREASDDDRRATRARLELDGGPLAVCIGRLSRQKGQDVLIEAWRSVAVRVPGARLALVGDGPDAAMLRSAAGPRIDFVGQREDIADWLAAADVVTAPSRWEGMSISMLEAMARGRSVVATDVPGAREALGEEAGAIVPPERPDALADALVLRLLDRERAAADGRAGRLRAERFHDLRQANEKVADLYRELIESEAFSS